MKVSSSPSNRSEFGETPPPSDVSLWEAWFAAAQLPGVDEGLRDIYQRMDDEIALRKPVCEASGRCCHFDAYGHRLYVTALEIAWMLRQRYAGEGEAPAEPLAAADQHSFRLSGNFALPQVTSSGGCPFQRNKLCSVRDIRPLGCRAYFCDPTARDWQTDLYERYLLDLRAMHDAFMIEYRYLEWRAGLAEAQKVLSA